MICFIGGCNEVFVETKPTETQSDNLEKESGLRIPNTYVHGYVTMNGNPAVGAKVELWKGGNLLPYDPIDSPYTDSNGFYNICVCCKGAGSGTYIVKAQKLYKPIGLLTDTDSFYWDWQNGGPWDFEIDLQLGMMAEKGGN